MPSDYSGEMLRSLIDSFAEPLSQHLRDEIDTLMALNKYDSDGVRDAYRRLEKLLMDTDKVSRLQRTEQRVYALSSAC